MTHTTLKKTIIKKNTKNTTSKKKKHKVYIGLNRQ